MQQFGTWIEFLATAVISEILAGPFLAGLVILLVGIAFTCLFIVSRFLGFRTEGVVVGAVEVVRRKEKDVNGEKVEKIKRSLYPVYEYTGSDGAARQMRGSEGGTMTLKYVTGQAVNLIVREDDGYDDVYDADEYGALYLGIGIMVFGVVLMTWIGSFAAAFGVSVVTLLLGIFGPVAYLLFRKEPMLKKNPSFQPYNKTVLAEDLMPVEHFQKA